MRVNRRQSDDISKILLMNDFSKKVFLIPLSSFVI